MRWILALIALSVGCGPESATRPQNGEPQPCVVRRAAFDVGSGTTKFKVADVDVCANEMVSVLDKGDTPVSYGDDVAGGGGPQFKEATMARGVDVLREFKTRADAHGPVVGYAGVATEAFRRADNAGDFMQRIQRELGIRVSVISQAQEARLGFLAGVIAARVDAERTVVWDVGGRSMQLTTLAPDGKLVVYKGELASGSMRDELRRTIQGKPDNGSPNPVSHHDLHAGVGYAIKYATAHVPRAFLDKLADDHTIVVGIGALKYYGDRHAAEQGAVCTLSGLEAKVGELLGKSDEEIGGDYAATAVSDRMLLIGFMWALGIERVQLADIDLTDGLLLDSDYWGAPATASERP